MRITIDMQGLQTSSRHRGIGKYCLALIRELLTSASGKYCFILSFNAKMRVGMEETVENLKDCIYPAQIQTWQSPGDISFKGDPEARKVASLLYSEHLSSIQPDLVLLTSIFEGYHNIDQACVEPTHKLMKAIKFAAILYDVIPLEFPDKYLDNPRAKEFYFSAMATLKKVDYLFAISKNAAVKYNLLANPHPNQLIKVIKGSIACARPPAPCNSSSKSKTMSAKPFALYVGASDYRKNIDLLFSCYRHLPASIKKTYRLKIASTTISRKNLIRLCLKYKFPITKVDILPSTTDDEVTDLYRKCRLFIMPSLSEGLGMPSLEAITHGAMSLMSGSAVLPELDDPRYTFDPRSPSDLATKISIYWENSAKVLETLSLQQQKISEYTWNNSAQAIFSVLDNIKSSIISSGTPRAPFLNTDDQLEKILDNLLDILENKSTYFMQNSRQLAKAVYSSLAKTAPHNRTIYVDISNLFNCDLKTGIQRVVRRILDHFQESMGSGWTVTPVFSWVSGPLSEGFFVAPYYQRHESAVELAYDDENNYTQICPRSGDIFLGLDLNDKLDKNAGYLTSMRANGVQVYFVLYDLIPVLSNIFMPAGVSKWFADWVQIVSRFDGIIAISASACHEAKEWISANCPPLHPSFEYSSFFLGSDINAVSTNDYRSTKQYEETTGITFLMVGTIEPRKAHAEMLNAFNVIWANGVDAKLVIVGKRGWMVDGICNTLINHPMTGKKLFWHENVNDQDLSKIYSSADCLLYPSHCEGFGLPVVEAAAKGLPLILRDIPVLRELAGDSAYYFSQAASADEIANRVMLWIRLYSDSLHPPSDGVKIISWEKSSDMLAAAIISADAKQQGWQTI